MACRALAQGDCSTALAGGVNAITSPDVSRCDFCLGIRITDHIDVSWPFESPLFEPDWAVQTL
jgi:hypothetical protein